MRSISLAACLALLGSVQALPSAETSKIETRDDRGSYTISGYGQRKKAILDVGGNTLDLAIGMLESDNMGSDYAYGDSKTGDAANFGIFKQNWGMLRVCASRAGFAGESESQWNDGAKINSNLQLDVASRWDCQNYYGYDKWFGGQRDGSTGLANPYTEDISNYKSAVEWIQQQIDSNPDQYKYDDTRFWVEVQHI